MPTQVEGLTGVKQFSLGNLSAVVSDNSIIVPTPVFTVKLSD